MFLYPKSEQQWNCIFLKILFSNKTKREVEEIHSSKKSIVDFNINEFQLKCECKDIEEADQILADISDLKITIDGLSARLLSPNYQNILENNIQLMENKTVIELYTIQEQIGDYPHRFIQIDYRETPSGTLSYYNFNPMDYSILDLDTYINSFLDTIEINSSNRNGIIIFPIYCRVINLSSNEKQKYVAKIEIDSSLFQNCRINYDVKHGNNIRYKIRGSDIEIQTSDFVTTILVKTPQDIGIDDYINIEIHLNEIGMILNHKISYDEINVKSHGSALHSVFDLFNASNSLATYIYSSTNEKKHLASSVWLLEILGFNCIPLGIVKGNDDE